MRLNLRATLLIFTHFLLDFDIIDAAITCNRIAGNNLTLPSNECTGSVCLIRKENTSLPIRYDCGEGAYYSHYPDGCYGSLASTWLCICRTSKCNNASLFTSSTMNANKPVINCNGTTEATTSTTGTCSAHFCLSHNANPTSPMYYCLEEPPTLLSFAPFIGLCYHFEYGSNNAVGKAVGSVCICDTDYCSQGITTLPTAPETITVGNVTTAGVECFTDENRTITCRGDVCFLYRHTIYGDMERGCLISQRNAEARRLLIPSYTRDVFVDYYICNTPQCNRNIATANASIVASIPVTTANPIFVTGTTPDEWWTTPLGWTGKPIDDNSTWWNNTWNETDPDWNSTNGSTTKPPGKGSQQYSLLISFLVLLFTTLIIS